MNAKTHTVIRLCTAALLLFLLTPNLLLAQTTRVVDASGGGDFTSIQAAIAAASAGDRIEVRAGTYHETGPIVFKPGMALVGAGRDVTFLKITNNATPSNIIIHTDNAELSGLTITNSFVVDRVIWVSGANIQVTKNAFTFVGINFHALEASGSGHLIEGNLFKDNGGFSALHVFHLKNSIVRKNKFINNRIGIQIFGTFPGSVAEENHIFPAANSIGIYLHGQLSVNGIVRNNFIQQTNSGGSGINMNSSWDALIEGNVIDGHFDFGMLVNQAHHEKFPQRVLITRNVITNTKVGGNGIYLNGTYGLTITNNRLACHTVGLQVFTSQGNHTIHHNNFINNTTQAIDGWHPSFPRGEGSRWDDGAQGNYWSNFASRYPAAGNDGTIWNTPYVIDGRADLGNPGGTGKDNFPLVNALSIGTDCTVPDPPTSAPPDADGDGVPDNEDAFPNDPAESQDSDGDGIGDNGDAFPDDPTESVDTDGDGVGDGSDAFPDDPAESADSDGDGVGDNGDAFPDDATESVDSDGDGVGDNGDAFPEDPSESADSDLDRIGENTDMCASTTLPDNVAPGGLNPNHWRVSSDRFTFEQGKPKGKGAGSGGYYDLAATAGCSCEQIIANLNLGKGQLKQGCSNSTMQEWTAFVASNAGKGGFPFAQNSPDAIPTDFVLEGNYPNPFNPQTTISFGLPEAAHITLVVYDMTGREVSVLVNAVLGAGMHTASFQARDLSSGAYVYRLTTPSQTITRTMMLLK